MASGKTKRKAGDINLKELQKQQRELEITTVAAQCRLGELTAEIPKAKNQHSACPSLGQANTKEQTLTDSGLTRQRASEYERMAARPDIAELVTVAEMQIGAMLKEIPKVEHKGNQYTNKMDTSTKVEQSKTQTVKDLGFSKDQEAHVQLSCML